MVAQINRLKKKLKKYQALVLCGCLVFFASVCFATPAVLTDDETESLLDHIVQPIFRAAGIAYDKNRIHLLDEMSLNAFVSDENHLFVHAGTIISAENVNELSGVLAHEAGHIQGGHIMRQKLKMRDLQKISAVSLVAAGAAAAASGRGDAALAIALGTQGSLLNAMIAYQLTEERSADESAVRYLKAIGQSPVGLKNFMKTIQKENRLSGLSETPYFRTHPMSAEREAFFEKNANANGGQTKSPYDQALKLVQAKLSAFLLSKEKINKKYPASDQSVEAKYAHAVLFLRQKNFQKAFALLEELTKNYPDNPYFEELKGQILFESGNVKGAAISSQKALQIDSNLKESLLLYALSTLESPNHQKELSSVIEALNKLLVLEENENVRAWELLSKAYYEQGRYADSLYALARYSQLTGNIRAAKEQMKKALGQNPSEALKLKISDLENIIESEEDEM